MNKKLKISCEIPSVRLCRFFSKKSYAEQFVNGNIRFGWQKKYTAMEGDIREDTTEGTASFLVDGSNPGEYFESGSIAGWESYILCASEIKSDSDIRVLGERFAAPNNTESYYVEILDLDKFTTETALALKNSVYWDAIDYIYWKKVEYSKFQLTEHVPPDVELQSYQKPPYISTYEFTNNKSGKKIALSSTHMYLQGRESIVSKYFPESEWTKSETRHDYTVEAEWRLIVSLKMRHLIESLQIPLFVDQAERERRICLKLQIQHDNLKHYSANEIDRLVPPSSFWIDTITVSNSTGFRNFVYFEKIELDGTN